MTPDERRLRRLLGPWMTPGLDQPGGFRFHDAPPDAVRRALAAVDPSITASRPNGQPPAAWLVHVAERLGGLLAGQVGDEADLPERLRVDAVGVPAEHAAELARAVDADWPDPGSGEVALDLALAEGWERWDSERPAWIGGGRDLLAGAPPGLRRRAVVGLRCILAALDVEVTEGRAANRSTAVRRGIARLQREQGYRGEEAILTELARRGDLVYPELSDVVELPHPPLD